MCACPGRLQRKCAIFQTTSCGPCAGNDCTKRKAAAPAEANPTPCRSTATTARTGDRAPSMTATQSASVPGREGGPGRSCCSPGDGGGGGMAAAGVRGTDLGSLCRENNHHIAASRTLKRTLELHLWSPTNEHFFAWLPISLVCGCTSPRELQVPMSLHCLAPGHTSANHTRSPHPGKPQTAPKAAHLATSGGSCPRRRSRPALPPAAPPPRSPPPCGPAARGPGGCRPAVGPTGGPSCPTRRRPAGPSYRKHTTNI